MFSFLQMPFLQALGYAIANSLWQIGLLWLIVILVNTFIRQSSHIKYITALSAQVAGFVWFVTTFQFYYNHCRAASAEAQQLISQNAVVYTQNLITGNDSLLSFLIRAEETLPYLSLAYLFLLVFLVIKWVRNFRYTKQLAITGLEPVDAKWQAFINEMSDRLDILQDVKIYLSSLAKSPLTIGYVKPIILLPIASINHLSTEQLEAVLLHEMAHIKRSDYIINMLVSVVEIILFFNPFTRLLGKLIKKERENCCDDWVLQYQYNAKMYAEALLRIAYLQRENGFQMNAATNKKGELLQRVKRMVQPGEKTFNYKHQIAALALITGLLFSIAWLQPGENNFSQKGKSNIKQVEKQIVVTPLTAQIDNPFFSAASLFSKSLQADVNKSIADLDKTITDSLTKVNLQEAQVALQKAAPAVISTISSGNWQKVIEQAKDEASKSLKNVDWAVLQQHIPQLVDSSYIRNSVNIAMSNADILNSTKQGLVAAQHELENLQLNKNFSKDYLQQLTTTALASLQNLNFKVLVDSIKKSAAITDKIIWEAEKDKQKQDKAAQKESIKRVRENYKKTVEVIRKNLSVAPLPPPPPAASYDNFSFENANEPVTVTPDAPEVNTTLFSAPIVRWENATGNHSKTICIVKNCDSSTINITIEIRQ